MYILSFDTCNGSCSVAISLNDAVLYFDCENEINKQAEKLFFMIEKALNTLSIWYDDLSALALTVGPGSFTGIRIGIAAAYGIILALKDKNPDLKVITLSTLDVVAYAALDTIKNNNINNDKDILALLNAGRAKFYSKVFNFSNSTNKKSFNVNNFVIELLDKECIAQMIDKYVVCGNFENEKSLNLMPNAKVLAKLSYNEIINKTINIQIIGKEQMIDISPIYIREADIGKSNCKSNLSINTI